MNKILNPKSQQRGEGLEVLSKTKQERLRQSQVNIEQSDSNWERQIETDKFTESTLLRRENEKKRVYNRRVIEIEQGVFTPLVFGTMARWEKNARHSTKFWPQNSQQNMTNRTRRLSNLRTKISFCLLKSPLLCLRGTRLPFYADSIINSN